MNGTAAVTISPEDADVLAARLLGDLRTKLGGLEIAHTRRVAAVMRATNDDRVVAAALFARRLGRRPRSPPPSSQQ